MLVTAIVSGRLLPCRASDLLDGVPMCMAANACVPVSFLEENVLAKIPQVLHEHINTAYPANVCLVGTVLPNGFAQITPRGSTMVFDDEHIALWERGKGTTTENLTDGTPVTIFMRKPALRETGILPKGGILRLYGRAKIADCKHPPTARVDARAAMQSTNTGSADDGLQLERPDRQSRRRPGSGAHPITALRRRTVRRHTELAQVGPRSRRKRIDVVAIDEAAGRSLERKEDE